MFPTTVWSTIHRAGSADAAALQRFAERYRPAVRDYVRRRGFAESDTEDICQDVFVRVLSGSVLSNADPTRGRFRSLLLTIASRTIADRLRKRRDVPTAPENLPLEETDQDPEFDSAWVLHLADRAMARLKTDNSPYYDVLSQHLSGQRQDRQRLWIARRKLIALIRNEIALTCRSHKEFEREVAYLSQYLRPAVKRAENTDTL